jgi:hypothetical protein
VLIKLFDRAPVEIDKEEWPVIAAAKDWDNQYEFQANRWWSLRVRQCGSSGRAIVYGEFGTKYQGERYREGGEVVEPGGDIPGAIRRVGERMSLDGKYGTRWQELIDECIGDLPAENLACEAA